jgi:cytidylate kinase
VTGVVVAIDGPAGSGKSSVSRAAASRLGFDFLDTGAAYRALTWLALERGVDTDDPDAVIALVDDLGYATVATPGGTIVTVGETDVTAAIREPRITAVVSDVARIAEVRARLTEMFRAMIAASREAGIVVEGRDITTVVAPDAPVRILLTASEEVRMARRSAELVGHSAEATGAQLRARDAADSKVVDFMNAADGVTTVDSTDLDFDATVEAVLGVIRDAQVRTG